MRRGCLFSLIGLLGVCLIACVFGYFVGLPRLRDGLREPLEEVVGTQIAAQIAPEPNGTPAPGTYVITEADLNAGLRAEVERERSFDDLGITLTPAGFSLRFSAQDNDATYTGNMRAANGRLDVFDLNADSWLTFFLREEDVEETLENAVNAYLFANNLQLTAAELGDGTLTLTTEAA